jgi:hypothetical protein
MIEKAATDCFAALSRLLYGSYERNGRQQSMWNTLLRSLRKFRYAKRTTV